MKVVNDKFLWDEGKELTNERKHGVTFVFATKIFGDLFAETLYDVDHGVSEDRWVVKGMTENDVLLVVACAIDEEDGGYVRLISARKATLRERREYESGEPSVWEPEMRGEYSVKTVSETKVDTVDDAYDDGMKAEYGFSNAVHGKFKHWRFPVHIDNEVLWHFHERARATGVSSDDAINEILRRHVGLPPRSAGPAEAAAERR
jgi:uncharacterized protein